jgi:5-oxoprolinase (ATP-hydrolysing) subunit A
MNVDINCDLGEGFNNDSKLMQYITSANIACGYHAGDAKTMLNTIRLCLKNKVAIGAHPGYPDLEGFGRRSMKLPNEEIEAIVFDQLLAIIAMVETEGGKLVHVKPHGALYNDAVKSEEISKAIVNAIVKIDPNLIFVGLANSVMIEVAQKAGLKTRNEVFADRNYDDNGHLIPRSNPEAVIHDVENCRSRVLKMVDKGIVTSLSGKEVEINADTICIHGDNMEALIFAKELNAYLTENGINLTSNL